jgi:hypothetical protein
MKTIYQGLATRNSLTSLKIRFPISRLPRPTTAIPPIPRLRKLHLENLDPLCYNDDVSLLIGEATSLESLKMHWSPRIRRERELSVSMSAYFGRLLSLKRPLRLKEIAFANLFSRNDIPMGATYLLLEGVESVTTINCMNRDDPDTIFVDRTWENESKRANEMVSTKTIRTDTFHENMARSLFTMRGIENIYLVSNSKNRHQPKVSTPGSAPDATNGYEEMDIEDDLHGVNGNSVDSHTPHAPDSSDTISPTGDPPMHLSKRHIAMASDCVAAITKIHGATLRKLLLFDSWNLGAEVMLNLLSSCPNLEQAGLAADFGNPDFPIFLRKCMRAAPKLFALRILFPPWIQALRGLMIEGRSMHSELMSMETVREEFNSLRFLAIGPLVLELGEVVDGRRNVREMELDDAKLKNVEIFSLDNCKI